MDEGKLFVKSLKCGIIVYVSQRKGSVIWETTRLNFSLKVFQNITLSVLQINYKNMPITKAKKQDILKQLNEIVDSAKNITFLSLKGITANDTVLMRKKLTSENVGLKVAKKTLIKKVLNDKNFSGEMPEFGQETAFAYGTDLLAPSREIFSFTKEHKGLLNIVGGVFDGVYKSKAEMMEIATIPPREVLLSKIAFLLKSPIQRLAIAVNEVSKTKN